MGHYFWFKLYIFLPFFHFQRVPPLKIDSLIDDLKDGTKLLALLEVLAGERLPVEKGRILRRPHYLSNCNTALEFLRSKRVSERRMVWNIISAIVQIIQTLTRNEGGYFEMNNV